MEFDSTTEKLIEIGIALSGETNLGRLLEKIVLELRTIIHADGGSLYLRDSEKLRFEVAQNDTLRRQKVKDFLLFKPYEIAVSETSIAGYVALTGTVLNIPNVYELAPDLPYRFNTSFDQRNNYRTQSLLAVPLKDQGGDIVGVRELINALDERGHLLAHGQVEKQFDGAQVVYLDSPAPCPTWGGTRSPGFMRWWMRRARC